MTLSNFNKLVLTNALDLVVTYNWRFGQAVFNMLDTDAYDHIARAVKEEYGVDCFYDDTKIDEFIECVYVKSNLHTIKNLKS